MCSFQMIASIINENLLMAEALGFDHSMRRNLRQIATSSYERKTMPEAQSNNKFDQSRQAGDKELPGKSGAVKVRQVRQDRQ